MMVGRFYRLYRLIPDRARAYRFVIGRQLGSQAIGLEILRRRKAAVFWLFVLVVATGFLDMQFANGLTERLPHISYLADRTHPPDRETLRELAAVVATATGVIMAILFSISLVVLQNTGERYGGRLVRFMLDEGVSSYVLNLLFLNFLYSAWLVVFLQAVTEPPVFSVLVLSALTVGSVMSLTVYAKHALGSLAPDGPIELLVNEILRFLTSLRSESRKQVGRSSVENWLRESVSSRLFDLQSLLDILGRRNDVEGISLFPHHLVRIIGLYTSFRSSIPSQSLWFPRRDEPVSPTERMMFADQRRMFTQLGRGRPTHQVVHAEWLEERVFAMMDKCFSYSQSSSDPVVPLTSMLAVLQASVSRAYQSQSAIALEKGLALGEKACRAAPRDSDASLTALHYASSLAHATIREGDVSQWVSQGTAMLQRLPSEEDIRSWKAPIQFEEVLLRLREKLILEVTWAGKVVTPSHWLEPELKRELSDVQEQLDKQVLSSVSVCLKAIHG